VLPEILAEKIRVSYQRNKARDIYDLGMFATRPLDRALIRRLVARKLWQAGDTFDPERLIRKFEDGTTSIGTICVSSSLGRLLSTTKELPPTAFGALAFLRT
jgi:hypothetical protein